MHAPLTCPRCGAGARPPGWWSDSWSCRTHGDIAPLHPAATPSEEALRQTAARSKVPLWTPWPLPAGYVLSGVRWAGDDHTGAVATVAAASGPNPLPDGPLDDLVAEVLLVAEQPGVGLGAHLAGLAELDPGAALAQRAEHEAPELRLVADGHDTPLWCLPTADAACYVGEASGVWLWVIAWPEQAGAVLLEGFELLDLRDPGHRLDLPFGALSPRLAPQ